MRRMAKILLFPHCPIKQSKDELHREAYLTDRYPFEIDPVLVFVDAEHFKFLLVGGGIVDAWTRSDKIPRNNIPLHDSVFNLDRFQPFEFPNHLLIWCRCLHRCPECDRAE